MSATLTPQLFAILSGLVEDALGIHYGPEDLSLFSDKITARAAEAGFDRILDYYYFLRYDPGGRDELVMLTDALVVNETYFFRELQALRAGVTHVAAKAIAQRGRARIWSAACSTGEEPLSLAMVLLEADLADRCDIIATDLSARALGKARQGVYGARSLRAIPARSPGLPAPVGWSAALAALADRELVAEGTGARVRRELLGRVTYASLNLLDDAAVGELGTFDLVLCRNVLIYFADPTVVRVVGSLARALEPDGALLVGASESLLRFGTVLHCTERDGAFFYETTVNR